MPILHISVSCLTFYTTLFWSAVVLARPPLSLPQHPNALIDYTVSIHAAHCTHHGCALCRDDPSGSKAERRIGKAYRDTS